MNPALTASGGDALIAASASATAAGDNQVARRLAGLRDQKITAGGTSTAAEAWSQLVYRAGRDRAAAFDAERTQTEVTRQIRNLQDGVSGVSLDEEAADLIRFQRAYEANARFFTTIDETLSTLLNMV
jgi:flagellar hook-associated protein 1 FlgK